MNNFWLQEEHARQQHEAMCERLKELFGDKIQFFHDEILVEDSETFQKVAEELMRR